MEKQPPAARDGEHHTAQLANELLPDPDGGAATMPRELVEEGTEALVAVGRELDGAGDRVDEPAQDDLGRLPGAVAFPQFFLRNGVAAKVVVGGVVGAKDAVDGVKQHATRPTAPPGPPWTRPMKSSMYTST